MKNFQKMTAVLATAVLCVVGIVSTGQASTTVGGTQEGTTGYYDYSPHGMRAGGYETEVWCGDTPGHTNDTILEQRYALSNWSVSVSERAAFQEGPAGSWDDKYTCNPSNVIQGSFPNVLGDGVTYTYVVYYVGFGNTTNINQIGAVFSTDGLNWVKYSHPVENYPGSCGGCYGYSQPNVTMTNGVVTLFYEDNPGNGVVVHHMATSLDGVHFTEAGTMSSLGLPTPVPNWGSVAFNPANSEYYMLANDGARPSNTTGGIQEQGDNGCTLYSTLDPIAGTWANLDVIDTNLTGYETNFLCGFVTDYSGNLSPELLPQIKILTSAAYPRPVYSDSGSQLGDSAAFNNWQIMWHQYVPGNVWRLLKSVDHSGGYHEVTTGYYDASYYNSPDNHVLGYLAEAPTGEAIKPLYGCKLGGIVYFVAQHADCYGQYKLGIEGYAYNTPASDRLPLYRCEVPDKSDFVSTDPNCEGQVFKELLGYSQA